MSRRPGWRERQQDPIEPPQAQRPNLVRAAGRGSRYLLAGKVVTASVTLGTLIFIVRHLSPREYGLYNLLLTIELYVGLFSINPFMGVFRRYLPEFRETGLSAFARKIILQGVGLCLIISFGIISLLLVLFPWWAPLLRLENDFRPTAIFLIACTAHFPALILWQSLTAFLLYKHIVAANIIYSLTRATVAVLLLLKGAGLLGIVIAEACGYLSLFLATAAFYAFNFHRGEAAGDSEKVPQGVYRRMVRYGIFHTINVSGIRIIGTETDLFAVSLLFPGPLVGLYALAARVVKNLENALPFKTLDDVLGPVFFSQYVRNKNPETLQVMFDFLTKACALILFPVVITVLVLGDIALPAIFGQQYASVYGFVSILCIALFFNTLRIPLTLVLLALERNDIVSLSRVAALYNLAAYVFLTPFLGIYGIAVATCSAAILQNILLYYFAVKLAGVRLEWARYRIAFAWFSLLGLSLACFRSFSVSLPVLALAAALGSIAVLWLCWTSGVFRANERQIILEFAGNLVGRPLRNASRVELAA